MPAATAQAGHRRQQDKERVAGARCWLLVLVLVRDDKKTRKTIYIATVAGFLAKVIAKT